MGKDEDVMKKRDVDHRGGNINFIKCRKPRKGSTQSLTGLRKKNQGPRKWGDRAIWVWLALG